MLALCQYCAQNHTDSCVSEFQTLAFVSLKGLILMSHYDTKLQL